MDKNIDDVIKMIDGKMNSGINKLSVDVSDELESGQTTEKKYYGRCSVTKDGSGCDMIVPTEDDK